MNPLERASQSRNSSSSDPNEQNEEALFVTDEKDLPPCTPSRLGAIAYTLIRGFVTCNIEGIWESIGFGPNFVAAIDKLPKCRDQLEKFVFYVGITDTFATVCLQGKWQTLTALKGPKGDTGKNGENGINGLNGKDAENIEEIASIIWKNTPSIVRIIANYGENNRVFGSGFIVASNLVVTAAHVVKETFNGIALDDVQIIFPGNGGDTESTSAVIMLATHIDRTATRFDIGLLKVSTTENTPLNLSSVDAVDQLTQGQSIVSVGYGRLPQAQLTTGNITGTLTSRAGFLNETLPPGTKVLAMDMPSVTGWSGAPVFNSLGDVIAFTFAGDGTFQYGVLVNDLRMALGMLRNWSPI